jgi:POT family proton-dependent oligopeptide transporter
MHLDTLSDAEPALAGQKEIGEPAAAGIDTRQELRP